MIKRCFCQPVEQNSEDYQDFLRNYFIFPEGLDFFSFTVYDITVNEIRSVEGNALTWRSGMIDFDEEIAKFEPSLEIEQAEEAIIHNDLSDIMDLIEQVMKEKGNR